MADTHLMHSKSALDPKTHMELESMEGILTIENGSFLGLGNPVGKPVPA